MEKTKIKQSIVRIMAVIVSLCILSAAVLSASASSENQKINDARSGVVQIQIWLVDPETAIEEWVVRGTGFLINESTVVTCNHVVNPAVFSPEMLLYLKEAFNKFTGKQRTVEEIKTLIQVRVSVYRDVSIKATIKKYSSEMDYAVLSLDEKVYDRTPLAVRDSTTVKQTEEVFALGFPGDILSAVDQNYYDKEDVTITSGKVNKVGRMSYRVEDKFGGKTPFENVDCIESGAKIVAGNSGGPLVDVEGNVVGINAHGDDTRNFAVCSAQLITVLKALGISYKEAGTVPTISGAENGEKKEVDTSKLSAAIAKAEALNGKDYSEKSFKKVTEELNAAKEALNSGSQSAIDSATESLNKAINSLEKKSPVNFVLIGIIAAVVIIIAAVVVIIIVVTNKKKKTNTDQDLQKAPVYNSYSSVPVNTIPVENNVQKPVEQPSSETSVLNEGAGETTVLAADAGETTVLAQSVNGGSLTRLSNNEIIPISFDDFTIGREKTKVNYCIGGNTNISRVHARFVVRDGKTYIIDNKSGNGTFVNGLKLVAGQETELKSGDKVVLADEEFKYDK